MSGRRLMLDAVNDLESLTTGVGPNIWQKINIIGALEERQT